MPPSVGPFLSPSSEGAAAAVAAAASHPPPCDKDDARTPKDDGVIGTANAADAPTAEAEEAAEKRYGCYCRAFYSSAISTGSAKSARSRRSDSSAADARKEGRDGRSVVEAVDLICRHAPSSDRRRHGSDSDEGNEEQLAQFRREYGAFLSRSRSASEGAALRECSLGTVPDALSLLSSPERLDRYLRMKDRARSDAHALSMSERDDGLRRVLLEETSEQQARRMTVDSDSDEEGYAGVVDVHAARSLLRRFVSSHRRSVGSHPLLAGLRALLERQLKEEGNVLVEWTFDGAAVTEGCRVRSCGGGGDGEYVREAVRTLTSFLVWVQEGEEKEGVGEDDDDGMVEVGRSPHKWRGTYTDRSGSTLNGNSNTSGGTRSSSTSNASCGSGSGSGGGILSTSVTFRLHPTLSDRSLKKLLEVLPPPKELHARPTGTLKLAADGGARRTNVGGEMDVHRDLCHEVMENVFGKFKLFCPR